MTTTEIRNHLYRTETQCPAMRFPETCPQTNNLRRNTIFWWTILRFRPRHLSIDYWRDGFFFDEEQYVVSELPWRE